MGVHGVTAKQLLPSVTTSSVKLAARSAIVFAIPMIMLARPDVLPLWQPYKHSTTSRCSDATNHPEHTEQ